MSGTSINWDNTDLPRLVGRLTGDARPDILGFAMDDVWMSPNYGDATFGTAARGSEVFCFNQAWRADRHVRLLADLTGSGRDDVVGFGDDGVWIALNNGDGTFAPARFVLANFGFNQGWRVGAHPRFLADLTGDGKPDIVGFGNAGVYVALNNGDGTFGDVRFVIGDLGYNSGWRVEEHVRLMADLTGDGRSDIVAFGNDGVWTAISNGDGTFAAPRLVLAGFDSRQGWSASRHVRLMADLTGDGRADIVGFGDDGVWTALGNGDGTFAAANFVIANLGYNQGWRPEMHPRLVADLTGKGRADIVAFGYDGVWTAVGNGDGSFAGCNFVLAGFNIRQGWQVDRHPRIVTDLNGDGRADILGFGDAGVWTAVGNGDGSFAEAHFVLADFGAGSATRHRSIPLDLLQSKFDLLFNERAMPLFQIRLDSPSRSFGTSTLKLALDQNNGDGVHYDFDHPMYSQALTGLSLSALGVDYAFYFQDLNSDKVTLKLVPGQPLALEMNIGFETSGGIEIKVEGHTGHDIDIRELGVTLRPEFTQVGKAIDLFGFVDEIEAAVAGARIVANGYICTAIATFRGSSVTSMKESPDLNQAADAARADIRKTLVGRFIETKADGDVSWPWSWGDVNGDLQSQFTSKIYDALRSTDTSGSPPKTLRQGLSDTLTEWLVGGPFQVVGVTSDAASLLIDFVVGPDQLDPFPENPQPPLDPGLLGANIDHIVVLMMENRSFDHMLGYLSLDPAAGGRGRTDIEGLRPDRFVPNGYQGKSYTSFRIDDPQFVHHSPPHSFEPVNGQIDGGRMDGFADAYGREYGLVGADASAVLGYFDGATLDVYDALAANFTVCDHWFAAHPGPTFCNRFYTLTGRLNRDANGIPEVDNFSGSDFVPVNTRTIFDHLSERGVSWRYYENRYCMLRLFGKYTFDEKNVMDFGDPRTGFAAAAAAGTLPAVTFIDPNFIDEPDAGDNDDAAPGTVRAGQALVGGIVNALMKGPKWNRTLFILTYDEHGGFFDHVSPLDDRYRANARPVSGIDHYGVRVPAIIVSPWVAKGVGNATVFDHTSIIKTISRCFMGANPPDMGERVGAANDLGALMLPTMRTDMPAIPAPAAPPRPAAAPTPTGTPAADSHDFKAVMEMMQARYPKPASTAPAAGSPVAAPPAKGPKGPRHHPKAVAAQVETGR